MLSRIVHRYADVARPGCLRQHRGLVLALLALAWAGAGPASGQFPDHLVNDDAFGEENRFDPVAAPLDQGGFLLLWVDNSRGHLDILAGVYDSELNLQEEPQVINQDGDLFFSQRDPAISRPNGGVITAAWVDGRDGQDDIYSQVFSSVSGTAIGDNAHLNMDAGFGRQSDPVAATDSQGRTLVCWTDNRTGTDRIWAQRVSAEGTLLGTNLEPAPEDPGRQQARPSLAPLPDGRWLLAWQEYAASGDRVRYRILDADGLPSGAILSVDSSSPAAQEEPAVLVRSSDALIAWADNREGTSDAWSIWTNHDGDPTTSPALLRAAADPPRDSDLVLAEAPDGSFSLGWFGGLGDQERSLMRLFGPDRTPVTADLPINDPQGDVIQRRARLIFLPDAGAWLAAWSDERTLSMQVFLELIDPADGSAGPEQPARTLPASASQIFGDVAFLPDGRAVVAWGDIRNGSFNVFARFLDSQGEPEGTSFQVNVTPVLRRFIATEGLLSAYAFAPQVAASGLGTFIVTWAADVSGGRLGLWAQLFDATGQPTGDNFLLSRPPTSPQYDPRPAMAPDGRFAIAWRDDRWEESGDIFLQRFAATGERLGDSLLVPEAGARPAAQQNPSLAISPYNEMVVAWIDQRQGGWDVYRQRIAPDGTRLDGPDVMAHPSDGPAVSQLYPDVATNGSSIVVVFEEQPLTQGLIRGRLEVLETVAPDDDPEQKTTARMAEPIDFTVNPADHPRGIKYPQVAIDPSGKFIVTWWDNDNGRTRVWAQRFDEAANPIGGPYSVSEEEQTGSRGYPRVALWGDRIQYVWTDSRRDRGWDVYARRVSWEYDGNPTPVELNFLEARSGPRGIELEWSLPDDANPLGFLVWREPGDLPAAPEPSPLATLLTPEPLRSTGDGWFSFVDIAPPRGQDVRYYLEELRLDGGSEFIGPINARWDGAVRPLAWSMSPNPFRDQIALAPPVEGPVRLVIWDVAGRQVRSLERIGLGGDPLVWDGRDEEGRPVAAGLYLVRPWGSGHTLKIVRVR